MVAKLSRVALVTGANKGIGLEVARQLGRTGCTVLLGARDSARGRQAEVDLRAEGLDAHFLALDVNRVAIIRRSKAGRIVNVSSGGGSLTLQSDPP